MFIKSRYATKRHRRPLAVLWSPDYSWKSICWFWNSQKQNDWLTLVQRFMLCSPQHPLGGSSGLVIRPLWRIKNPMKLEFTWRNICVWCRGAVNHTSVVHKHCSTTEGCLCSFKDVVLKENTTLRPSVSTGNKTFLLIICVYEVI